MMNNEKSETHIHKLPTRHSFQSSLAWKPLSYSKLFGVYGGVIQIALRSYSSRQLCRPVLSAWLIVALGSSCRLLQPDPWPDHHSSNFSGPRCLKHEPWGWDTSSACEVCSSLSSCAMLHDQVVKSETSFNSFLESFQTKRALDGFSI